MLHKFIESPLWVLLVLLSTVGKAQKITETEKQSKVSQGEKLRRDWWMIHIFKSFSSVISILFLEEKKKKSKIIAVQKKPKRVSRRKQMFRELTWLEFSLYIYSWHIST